MAFVYVLRSLKNNKRYTGYTSRDVALRLNEHNSGLCKWTGQNRPFVLVFVQECTNIKEARDLEKFLKSGQGRICLDELGI